MAQHRHVELATEEWVDWFNHRRLYEYCGDVPPADMEAAHYAQTKAVLTAALSNSWVSGHPGAVQSGFQAV